jgi:hypothetical protein
MRFGFGIASFGIVHQSKTCTVAPLISDPQILIPSQTFCESLHCEKKWQKDGLAIGSIAAICVFRPKHPKWVPAFPLLQATRLRLHVQSTQDRCYASRTNTAKTREFAGPSLPVSLRAIGRMPEMMGKKWNTHSCTGKIRPLGLEIACDVSRMDLDFIFVRWTLFVQIGQQCVRNIFSDSTSDFEP